MAKQHKNAHLDFSKKLKLLMLPEGTHFMSSLKPPQNCDVLSQRYSLREKEEDIQNDTGEGEHGTPREDMGEGWVEEEEDVHSA